MPVEAVARVVQHLPRFESPDLLVGAEHFSDAGVVRLSDDLAIVQSLDFFPPVVNDPFIFGQVAAANALSDIYALLATPRTAMNIVGFPDKELSEDILHAILAGGAERVREAGAMVVGGHSVRDNEIKYGLSITGVVHPKEWVDNSGARAGDALILTKGLGTGVIATAVRSDRCPDDIRLTAEASMTALNRGASVAARAVGVHASTDVTGFGLAGHAYELAEASNVTIDIDVAALPLLPGAIELSEGNQTRANSSNETYLAPHVSWNTERTVRAELVYDPQTSGGLLLSVAAEKAVELVDRCRAEGAEMSVVIGAVSAARDGVRLVFS